VPEADDTNEGGTILTMSQAHDGSTRREQKSGVYASHDNSMSEKEQTMERLKKSQLGPMGADNMLNTPELRNS